MNARPAGHVGVDGCKAGWLAVTRSAGLLRCSRYTRITYLTRAFSTASRICIDIPIGLPWQELPIRPCDHLARQTLGRPRQSSVFPVPCRQALGSRSLAKAREVNQAELGRSIGAQSWGIAPKIREVDQGLQTHRSWWSKLREVHPEVCFWALAGRRPMAHSKKKREGREERLRVLERYEPTARVFLDEVLKSTRHIDIGADDVLDALVALITAEATLGRLTRLVGDPAEDLTGLPMEMLYLEVSESRRTSRQ